MALVVIVAAPVDARAQRDVPPEPVLPPPPVLVPVPAPPPAPAPAPPAAPLPLVPTPPPVLVEKPKPKQYESVVVGHIPSPQWTQDRNFTSTRFWLLDPGRFEAQVWWRTRVFDDHKANPTEQLYQAEIEIGLAPHLQLDLYENLTYDVGDDGDRRLRHEGNQIELRIAIPSYYGQMFGNPVIYLEWHPRHDNPDRFEARLLLGGAPTRWLYLAVNPYVETNVEPTELTSAAANGLGQPLVVKQSKWIYDMEFGATVAAGFWVREWLRFSLELKIGADMLGAEDNALHFVAFLGPGFILKPIPRSQRLKIMFTSLFGVAGQSAGAQRFEPLLIVGSQW
jgi:hypothetical protein